MAMNDVASHLLQTANQQGLLIKYLLFLKNTSIIIFAVKVF